MEVEEVEVPHLEGAIVGAVPGAHAAVVRHVVQTFRAVRGRLHRTNVFAGSVFALHAGDGLLHHLRVVLVARVVTIHADPMHFASAQHLVLAHHRRIIFRHARDHTGIASRTGGEIDRHAPLVAGGVADFRVDRMNLGNLRHLFDKLGVLLVLVNRTLARQRTAVLVVTSASLLRGRECLPLAGRGQREA